MRGRRSHRTHCRKAELGFFVANVDNAYAELVVSGAEAVTPPKDRAWGQRTAYVRDPDGHLIELVESTR